MNIQLDIHGLEWVDGYGTYRICPSCNSVMILMSEDAGQQEWLCENCWHVFDADGQHIGTFRRPGLERIVCPACGDPKIDRDPYDNDYYCRNCKSAFRQPQGETIRNADGQAVNYRITDLGPAEYPEICPNCGDRLRRQFFETPAGDVWAFPCNRCDIVYLADDDRRLVRPPACPRCGGYALSTYTLPHADFSVRPPRRITEEFQQCRLCGTKFDLDGDYLDDADRPTEGQRQSGNYSIGTAPTAPKIGG